LVRVTDTATAWKVSATASEAFPKFVQEGLIYAAEFHVLFLVLGHDLTRVLTGEVTYAVVVKDRVGLIAVHWTHLRHLHLLLGWPKLLLL